MIEGVNSTSAAFTGYFNDYFSRSLNSGKVPEYKEERKLKIKFEEDRKKIQPIYNSQGKLIDYDDSGRHLDFNF